MEYSDYYFKTITEEKAKAKKAKVAADQAKFKMEKELKEQKDSKVTGTIGLIEEFHLPGQHDQSSHGKGGGSGSGATGKIGPSSTGAQASKNSDWADRVPLVHVRGAFEEAKGLYDLYDYEVADQKETGGSAKNIKMLEKNRDAELPKIAQAKKALYDHADTLKASDSRLAKKELKREIKDVQKHIKRVKVYVEDQEIINTPGLFDDIDIKDKYFHPESNKVEEKHAKRDLKDLEDYRDHLLAGGMEAELAGIELDDEIDNWYDEYDETNLTGYISLSDGGWEDVNNLLSTELHLIGQHDQSSHGHGGGGGHSFPRTSEKELASRVASATKRKSLAGGKSGAEVDLVWSDKGQVIHKKGTNKLVVDSEYLASKVGQALNAPVPSVAKIGRNKSELAIDFVPGEMAGTFARGVGRVLPLDRKARSKVVSMKGAKQLGMLDIAINNVDRHGGNVMIRKDGKGVAGIDHGTAFAKQTVFNPATPFESHYKKTFTKSDYNYALKKVRPLKSEFVASGREDWYNSMVGRLETHANEAKR